MNDRKKAVKENIAKLNAEKNRLDREMQKLESVYLNTAISTGALIKQLDELGKIANGFNKVSQRLNIGYLLSTIIQIEATIPKRGDPTELQRVSIWTNDQNQFMRDYLFKIVTDLHGTRTE